MDDVSYRALFDQSPVATFFEDFSAVAAWMQQRRNDGVRELRPLLEDALLEDLRPMITVLDVNETAVRMFGEQVRTMLVEGLTLASGDSRNAFREQLVALWDGRERLDIEFPALRGVAGPLDCLMSWSVMRIDDQLDASRVVVTVADVSEQRAADRQIEQRADRLELLHDVAVQVAAQRSVEEIFQLIADGALRTLSARQSRLLILDEDMPRLGGLASLRRIRRSRPDVPAIMITGLPEPQLADLDLPDVRVLRKPFQLDDLADVVEQLLDVHPVEAPA